MIGKSLLLGSYALMLSANTTMCYKNNHLDPSSIESTYLDGGKCDGKLSVNDMKKDGYKVDTIKIQNSKNTEGLNYIYIFKKEIPSTPLTTNQLKAKIKELNKEDKQKKDENKLALSIESGKKLYIKSCADCHGVKAKKEAYNSSRSLASLSLEDIQDSILAYSLGEQDNGMAIVMESYARGLNTKDTENIYNYIQTIK